MWALHYFNVVKTKFALGPRVFENCTNLTELNISADGRLQAFGTHTVRSTESPEVVVNGTKVTKIVLPVTVEKITSGSFTQSNVRELWIYNKDLQFVDIYSNDNKDGYVLPSGTVIYGVKGSTAEEYCTTYKVKFEYLDGGPEKEPDEPVGEDKPEDEDTDYTEDPITPPDDSQGAQDTIIYVDGASDLTLIIVIAVSILLLVLLLAVAVVVVVVVKSKRDSIY